MVFCLFLLKAAGIGRASYPKAQASGWRCRVLAYNLWSTGFLEEAYSMPKGQ